MRDDKSENITADTLLREAFDTEIWTRETLYRVQAANARTKENASQHHYANRAELDKQIHPSWSRRAFPWGIRLEGAGAFYQIDIEIFREPPPDWRGDDDDGDE